MVRFTVNRGWAFILALGLFTICFLVIGANVPSPAHASFTLGAAPQVGDPQLSGDPDVPTGPGDGAPRKSGARPAGQVVSQTAASPVGDGVASTSVVVSRLRLILLGLRLSLLRF